MPPFDPDFDADNPYLDVPERFVLDTTDDFEPGWEFQIEAMFDPDL